MVSSDLYPWPFEVKKDKHDVLMLYLMLCSVVIVPIFVFALIANNLPCIR